MHVVFRESHGLEETETPVDLCQDPADLAVLSFSDSDLGAFAEGWHRAAGGLPTLRLANLAALRHPLSVDTYVERTLGGAKGILVRLIGGVPYWAYGLGQVETLARARGIALAVLPADGRPDARLDAASTLPVSTLRRLAALCDAGGAVAAQAALAQLALAAGLYAGPVAGAKAVPEMGGWTPAAGVCDPAAAPAEGRPVVVVTFYRAYVTAADLAPIEALFAALTERGFAVMGLFAPSLKARGAAEWVAAQIRALAPVAVVNATAFSARDGGTSPLDAGGVPVFQVALATSTEAAWREAERGLSPADLAMHVVLPEVDGRIFAGAVSFKEAAERDAALQFARVAHRAEPGRVAAAADRVAGWVRLAALAPAQRRVALVLSTYPGRDWQMAHAVGLDALASAEAMLEDLCEAGYAVAAGAPLAQALAETVAWPVAMYRAALARLPQRLQRELAVWGEPEDDPACDGLAFRFQAVRRGSALVALQPERGAAETRVDEYHDLRRVPRHGYVAFYLWLQAEADALVHIGAHGTLEWLPGKAVALSEACWPEALTGPLPVIYPFIVNDPGEAAQAKRRIGAVTLGHVPPPLRAAGTPERLARLEALLDEFSNADGLDPRRRGRLIGDIRDEARAAGVEADLRLDPGLAATDAITRIDRFVCDVKESQFGDGLHVWGRGTPGTAGEPVSAESAWARRVDGPGATPDEGPAGVSTPVRARPAPMDGRDCAPTLGPGASLVAPPPALQHFPAGRSAPAGHEGGETTAVAARAAPSGQARGAAALGRRGLDAPGGRPPPVKLAASAEAERKALLTALAGRRIEPGPSGSPFRGRADVLPTGRNLFTTDPRAVPTRAAHAQGVRLAAELVRRHLQDQGDWPRGLVVDLWGSATMRTAGEEFAMALHLLGARPVWDEGSGRVSGSRSCRSPFSTGRDSTSRCASRACSATSSPRSRRCSARRSARSPCATRHPTGTRMRAGTRSRGSTGRGRAPTAWASATPPWTTPTPGAARRARPGSPPPPGRWTARRRRTTRTASPRGSRRRTPSSTCKTCPRPTCCSPPTTPATRRASPRQRPWRAAAARRSGTSTPPTPTGRARGRSARRLPAWCAPARRTRAGSPGCAGTGSAARPRSRRRWSTSPSSRTSPAWSSRTCSTSTTRRRSATRRSRRSLPRRTPVRSRRCARALRHCTRPASGQPAATRSPRTLGGAA